MPSPVYNNKTLAEQEARRKLGVTIAGIDQSAVEPYAGEPGPSADELLSGAKNTLANAERFATENDTARLAALPESLAALKGAADTRGTTRKITEGLSRAGGAIGLAGLPAAAVNPLIGGTMMTAGGLATIPDYLRREFAPETDEPPVGMMERGMAALAAAPAVSGGLGALRRAATAAKWGEAAEVPYDISRAFPTGPAFERSAAGAEIPAASFPKSWQPFVQAPEGATVTPDLRNSPAFKELQNVIGRTTKRAGYSDELGRAMNAEPTPNARAVFDRMSREGAFGPEQAAHTVRKSGGKFPADIIEEPVVGPSYDDIFGAAPADVVPSEMDAIYERAIRTGRYAPGSEPKPLPPAALRGLRNASR